MAKAKEPNYTAAQEQRIREAADQHGKLNASIAAGLADEMGKSARSVIAKITRMALPYATKEPTTKNGDPVVKKGDLVARIGEVVEGNLEGLDKAPKAALHALARFVAANG